MTEAIIFDNWSGSEFLYRRYRDVISCGNNSLLNEILPAFDCLNR
jgi:hypothetical protein